MRNALVIIQMVISVVIVAAILLQAKGTGFGTNFSGGSSYLTRRGLEKIVFNGTIGLVVIWGAISIALLFPIK